MTMTDPIADMLTRVRNANSAGKPTVSMPSSKKLVEIARIMQEEGYVQGYDVIEGEPRATLEITLKYGDKKAKTIRGIKRISKPGLRIYAGKDELLSLIHICNNNGRITTRHQGGGNKRRYRIIDFKRNKDGVPAKVATIEYDPNRSARIALLHYVDGEKRYILHPKGLRVGDKMCIRDRCQGKHPVYRLSCHHRRDVQGVGRRHPV